MARSTHLVVAILLTYSAAAASAAASGYLSNEYVYSFRRDALAEAELKFERKTEQYSWDEETVNHYLQYLKWLEFKATKRNGFPPSRPIEEQLNHIQTTEIYKALLKFPKGGNMHTHENHDVSKKILFDIVWNSPDFQYVFMLPPDHPTTPWMLDFYVNPPRSDPPWINVRNNSDKYPKEEILRHQTFIGILSYNATRYPTDSGLRWREMGVLWSRSSNMISNMPIKLKYIRAMYEVGLAQGVIYFETRKNLYESIYVLNPSAQYNNTNGRQYLKPDGEEEIEAIIELAKNFSEEHPEFVGHKRISTVRRQSSSTSFESSMENVVRLRKLYPDHVLGFDAVGEEDAGYAHLYYLSQYLQLYNSTTGELRVPLYLHTAETNWPDDFMASDLGDVAPSLMNTYEAILLSASRLGHGNGFIKHPYLLTLLKKQQTPMEICVVSNQLLGYSADIRNHPAQHFLRYGIPIMLGADDAGTFGYDNFTVDWYEAFMGWGLDLEDLKRLALYSLQYSGLSAADKKVAIEQKWRPMYDKYVGEMYAVACSRNYSRDGAADNRIPLFTRILPREGARSGTTKVHVLGLNFETGICQNVACRFGDRKSRAAAYVSNQHILCESPDFGDQSERSVEVFVALDGSHFVTTGFSFTYKYDVLTDPATTTTVACDKQQEEYTDHGLALRAPPVVVLTAFCWSLRTLLTTELV